MYPTQDPNFSPRETERENGAIYGKDVDEFIPSLVVNDNSPSYGSSKQSARQKYSARSLSKLSSFQSSTNLQIRALMFSGTRIGSLGSTIAICPGPADVQRVDPYHGHFGGL